MSEPKYQSPLKRHNADKSDAASPAKKDHLDGSEDELDFDAIQLEATGEALLDFDRIKKEDIVTKGLAEWQVDCKDVNVRVQVVRIKLDKEFPSPFKNNKNATSQVFSLLVEDKTGATHVCSFGDSAKRLKNLLGDQRECVAIFENLEARSCKEEYRKFLPGRIQYELHFAPRSTVFFPDAPREIPEMLAELSGILGRREVSLNVVIMSKFTENVHSDGRCEWKTVLTDGVHMVNFVLPFAPHFAAGDEIKLSSATMRYSGNDNWLTLKDASDVALEDVQARKVPRKGLKRADLTWLQA